MKLNPPVKYYGSKGGFYNKIIEQFPKTEYDTYIEPYGGTYVVGLMSTPAKIEVYNDLEQNVYSLYKVLSDKALFEEFKFKTDLCFYSEDLRKECKENLSDETLSLVDRAFNFFYANRTSHNGIGGFSMNSHVRRGMSKSVSDFLSCIDRLPELHDRLSRVMVTNMDGVKLIKKYNRENVFIYCDPPYEQSTRTSARYKVDMDREGHIQFLDAVIESKSKILISGYDCELYERLTDNGFSKIQFEVKTIDGNFNKKTKLETLWKNY
jgi:DNA adenine methylase